jgi:BolA protein
MDTPDTRTVIHEKLSKAFDPLVELDVIDQSAAHAGHAGARESGGGHFQVIIVAPAFEGMNLVQRQRKVYEVLADEMQTSIHALSMTCLTPSEYEGDD